MSDDGWHEFKPERGQEIERVVQKGVEWISHPALQCWVERIEYDFRQRLGTVHMLDGSCTSMTGAIQLFLSIDAAVREIRTYAARLPDTDYIRRGRSNNWRAVDGRHPI